MSEENKLPISDSETVQDTRLTRRQFLTLAGTASAAALLAACAPSGTTAPAGGTPAAAATKAPAVIAGTELSFLNWTNFQPDMDTKFDELAKKWGDQNKVNVKVEHININDIPTRRAAAIQAKSGPDVIWDTQNWPQLFADSLVDVSDVVTSLDKTLEGVHEAAKAFDFVNNVWRGVPFAWGGAAFVYRTDWYKEANLSVPKTWDDFVTMAATLKSAGRPVGQAIGHSFGDPGKPRGPSKAAPEKVQGDSNHARFPLTVNGRERKGDDAGHGLRWQQEKRRDQDQLGRHRVAAGDLEADLRSERHLPAISYTGWDCTS